MSQLTKIAALDTVGPICSGIAMKVCERVRLFESDATADTLLKRTEDVLNGVLAKKKHFRFFRLLAVLYETFGRHGEAAEKRLGETRALEKHYSTPATHAIWTEWNLREKCVLLYCDSSGNHGE